MTDLRTGQADGFAQTPLPKIWIGKARQSVALALPPATSWIQGQRSGAEPGQDDMLSVSLPEGHVLGLDPGAKVTGFAAFAPGTDRILAWGEFHLRQDIKGRMEDRAGYRRNRRSKKWFREKRFDNRTREEGWLPPTMESKLAAHLALVKWLSRCYDIRSVIIEHGKWDTHALKEGRTKLAGWQYQRGELYGFENVKCYVRQRDDYTCQVCLIDYARRTGKKATGDAYRAIRARTQERGVEVAHLTPRAWGSNVPGNLCVMCHDHNHEMGQRSIEEYGYPELRTRRTHALKWAAHVNVYVPELVRRLETTGLMVALTRGYVTKVNRQALGLDKEHYTDAAVIASQGKPISGWPDEHLRTRWMGRHRRQLYRANSVPAQDGHAKAHRNEQGQCFNPVQPNYRSGLFTVGDYVEHTGNGTRGFIQAIMSSGSARVVGVMGQGNTKGVWSLKKLRVVEKAPRLRFEFITRRPVDPV